jgi:hypothetical protein
MNKIIYPISTGLLIILASLISVPAQSQIPGASPTPSSSPTPSPSPTTGSSGSSGSSSTTPSSSSTPDPNMPTGSHVITKFECVKRNSNSSPEEVLIRANGYYTLPEGTGKYQKIDQGYRFLSGSFREQSIVRGRKGFVLVATKDETKSMSTSVSDGAPVCSGGNIYR